MHSCTFKFSIFSRPLAPGQTRVFASAMRLIALFILVMPPTPARADSFHRLSIDRSCLGSTPQSAQDTRRQFERVAREAHARLTEAKTIFPELASIVNQAISLFSAIRFSCSEAQEFPRASYDFLSRRILFYAPPTRVLTARRGVPSAFDFERTVQTFIHEFLHVARADNNSSEAHNAEELILPNERGVGISSTNPSIYHSWIIPQSQVQGATTLSAPASTAQNSASLLTTPLGTPAHHGTPAQMVSGENICRDDAIHDRVFSLTGLITGVLAQAAHTTDRREYYFALPLSVYMRNKIQHCGMNSCVQTFSERSVHPLYRRGVHLTPAAALSLCQKVESHGECMLTQGVQARVSPEAALQICNQHLLELSENAAHLATPAPRSARSQN